MRATTCLQEIFFAVRIDGVAQSGQNPFSTDFSTDDQEAVMALIVEISQQLPFLVDLGLEERRSMTKLGDRNRAFTRKALEIATQNPDFLPRSL